MIKIILNKLLIKYRRNQYSRRKILITGVLVSTVMLFLVIPQVGFEKPLSTVLYDCNGELLGAQIADDGQWRFRPVTPFL
jgi:penicillin-binding protein 1C